MSKKYYYCERHDRTFAEGHKCLKCSEQNLMQSKHEVKPPIESSGGKTVKTKLTPKQLRAELESMYWYN